MLSEATIKRRRTAVGICSIALTLVLAFGLGHSGAHMLQNILVPGLGLHERSLALAIVVFLSVLAALVAWIRWGIDWLPALIVVVSTIASGIPQGAMTHAHAASSGGWVPTVAAHEFPIVVAVVAAIIWLQGSIRSMPVIRHVLARSVRKSPSSLTGLPATECSQGAIVAKLAGLDETATEAAAARHVESRARLIGQVARFRFSGEPFAVDHGVARAALLVTGQLSDEARMRLLKDSADAAGGVPCSEPCWLRFLDGTLTAIALHDAGDTDAARRWTMMLAGPLKLRRGHRPAIWWTPLGVPFGNAALWEHTLATALAHRLGWCGDEDWYALRPQLLGAAARGASVVEDERAIAAGRLWLSSLEDEQALRILSRPTVQHDPIACAIEQLRTNLHRPVQAQHN